MPSGDAAWGKATIRNDDIVIPEPDVELCVPAPGESGVSDKGGCLVPPWRITAENVGLSRPTSSVIVGLPLTFYLKNVASSCLPDDYPAAYEGHCGDDIWPTDHRSKEVRTKTDVDWTPTGDGKLEAYVFTGERIEIQDGDPYEPALWVCRNIQDIIRSRSDYGREAPGRRYVYDRVAPADDEPGRGECSFEYQEWGGYDLRVSVVWNVRKCAGPDVDPDKKPPGEPDGMPAAAELSCSPPQELVDTVVIPVDAARLIQVITESNGVVYPEGDYGEPTHSVKQ